MRKHNQHGDVALVLGLSLVMCHCSTDFDPVSLLSNFRVLAIDAQPLELSPQSPELTLRPVVYLPDNDVLVSQSWEFCPFTLGPQSAYRCLLPACLVQLQPDQEGRVTTKPNELISRCLDDIDLDNLPEGVPDQDPEKVEIAFSYHATSQRGTERTAIARIPVYLKGAPASTNQAPVISQVQLNGLQAVVGETSLPVTQDEEVTLRVQIDAQSLDSYLDESGREISEEAVVSFYATGGRFEFDQTVGTDVTVSWKAEKIDVEQSLIKLFVVVRDLRGGQAVGGPYEIRY